MRFLLFSVAVLDAAMVSQAVYLSNKEGFDTLNYQHPHEAMLAQTNAFVSSES